MRGAGKPGGRLKATLTTETRQPWSVKVRRPAPALGAVGADGQSSARAAQPAAVLHQKAIRTSELVAPLGNHRHRQLFSGQVGTGQLEEDHTVGVVVGSRGRRGGKGGR